jgi:CrcB protein
MGTLAAVAVGGALGASTRYGVDRLIEERVESLFPWATFVVNISGCMLSALLVTLLVERAGAPSWLGVGAVTGFVGAYTTFSTFAFESYELGELGHAALGAAYIGASIAAGIAAIALGQWLGRTV